MPLNSQIPLMTHGVDASGAISAGANQANQLMRFAEEKKQAPIRNRLLDLQVGNAEGVSRQQQGREAVLDAVPINASLQRKDNAGALALIDQRIQKLTSQGRDPSDSIAFRERLINNPDQAALEIADIISMGQQTGILKAPQNQGFTLGQGQQRYDAAGNLIASGAPKVNEGRDSLTQVQSSQILPDGSTVQVFKDGSTRVTGPQGRPLMGQEREDAVVTAQEFGIDVQSQRAGGRTEATETEKRNSALVVRGIAAAESTAIVRRALNLLDTVKTGGVNAIALATRQRLGIEGANEGELSNSLGKSVLSQLRETFGAAFTENEGKRLERIEAGFGKSPETNRRLLTQALRIAENTANRAAKVASDGEKADIEELLTFSLEVDNAATGQDSAPGAGSFQSTSGITFTVEE